MPKMKKSHVTIRNLLALKQNSPSTTLPKPGFQVHDSLLVLSLRSSSMKIQDFFP